MSTARIVSGRHVRASSETFVLALSREMRDALVDAILSHREIGEEAAVRLSLPLLSATERHHTQVDFLARVLADEPVFVLFGRDVATPPTLKEWVRVRRATAIAAGGDPAELRKIQEIDELGDEMTEWRRVRDGEWRIPSDEEGRAHYNTPAASPDPATS